MSKLHVLAIGPFGEAVANYIVSSEVEDVTVTRPNENGLLWPATWPHAEIHILASWRLVPLSCELMERLSVKWNVPWIPITMDSSTLHIGPVVLPDQEGCYSCFRKRIIQHSIFGDYIPDIENHYNERRSDGPKGFISTYAAIAANKCLDIIDCINNNPNKVSGMTYEIDLVSGNVQKGKTISVHGCPKCGINKNEKERSYLNIITQYDRIFS